jgi:hypothetical protein
MERELQEEIMMRRDKEVRDVREERLFQVRKIRMRHSVQMRDVREERLFQVRKIGKSTSYRSGESFLTEYGC